MTSWNPPAFGVVLAKLASLAVRAERLRLATQAKSSTRMLALLARKSGQ